MAGCVFHLYSVAALCAAVNGFDHSSRLSQRFLVDNNVITVSIDAHKSIHTVTDKFISVTLDSGHIRNHWSHFNVSDPKLQNLAKGLAPAYLRVGGTTADHLSFKKGPSSEGVYTTEDIDRIYSFAQKVGWEMIFDLNLLHRHNGEWDSTNGESVMRYMASKGYKVNLELGNEPNLYERNNVHLDPVQIGHDYGKLRHLMNSIHPFNERFLMGPAVSGWFHVDYCQKFLSTGSTYIDAFSFHHYYMDGHTAKQENFLDPEVLDTFHTNIGRAKECLTKSKGTKKMWLAETSSAYGGGAHILSESYIAGFLWLDKLGMAASSGIEVVNRQNFLGGRYSLITAEDNPLPDYWITYLFNKLVGSRVLKVTSSEHNHKFRIYAHCSADRTHPHGVAFYFQNMYSSEVKLTIPQYTSHYYLLYILTAGGSGSLTTTAMKLNGHEIRMNGNSLPKLEPISQRTWPVKIPGHSFGFLVSPHAEAAACH